MNTKVHILNPKQDKPTAKIEISEDTLRGLFLILAGCPSRVDGQFVNSKAIPIMQNAQDLIIELGHKFNFDGHGLDLL